MATIRPTNTNSETIRPDMSNNEDTSPTIRPNGKGVTIRPGSDLLNSNDNAPTVRPRESKTVNPNQLTSTTSLNEKIDTNMYQPRESYLINGVEYKTIKPLSLTSGEAQVFLVEDPSGVNHVLKLYYKGATPKPEVLDKVLAANSANILFHECSHGAFEDRYFELIKYYAGDNLEKVDVRKNMAAIIPLIKSMAIAIDFCHQLGFIHRDIKPSNFMFDSKNRNNLLLGDFGIAVKCDKDGMCVSDMARTKIFAAPEVYLNTGDGKAKFSLKSDFYSLGITIIYLWMGRDLFAHFEKENELQLATMKAYGNLPVPGDMPERLYSLVKALIDPNPTIRAGFKEVEEWLNGGNPFTDSNLQITNSKKSSFKVVFNGEQNLVASSPKELATIMYVNQQLAISYLYKGRITQWLEDNGRPELAVEMERIKEDLYPTSPAAGVEAACYILNPSMPFEDICGNKCTTSTEIAKSILYNFDQYLLQLSTNPDSKLLVFLQTHGLESAVMEFKKEFFNNNRLGLLYLIYRLDANQPWRMTDVDGREGSFDFADEILNWVSQYAASDQSLSDIVSNAFFLWISKRNTMTAAAIKPLMAHQGNIDYSEGVLYRLNPKVGLYFILDETSPNYILSIQKMAQLINECFMTWINGADTGGIAHDVLLDVIDIHLGKKSSIYHFLKSKGATYEKWIDWIKYCLDTKSTDNTNKAGPYNDVIGFFKLIKGMGGEVSYKFKSGKIISQPSELSDVSATDLQEAKADPKHALEAWIAVFYQEDPALDKSVKYSYEQRTIDYLNFLSSKGFKTIEIQRYKASKQIVESRAKKLRSTLSVVKTSRLIMSLITLLPLCIAAILLAFLWRPDFGKLDFSSVFSPTAIILTILMCLIDGFAGKIIGEIVWGCLIGSIVSGIIVLLSGFVSGIAPYATAALVIALGIYFYKKCVSIKLKENENDGLLNPTFEHLELEPLHEAFRPNADGFDSSIGDRTQAYQNELSGIRKMIWRKAIPVGIITILGILYFSGTSSTAKHADDIEINEAQKPDFSNGLNGTWVGQVNNNVAQARFEKSDATNTFLMVVTTQLENKNTGIKFTGTFDSKENRLTMQKCEVSQNFGTALSFRVSGELTLSDDKITGKISMMNRNVEDIVVDLQYASE